MINTLTCMAIEFAVFKIIKNGKRIYICEMQLTLRNDSDRNFLKFDHIYREHDTTYEGYALWCTKKVKTADKAMGWNVTTVRNCPSFVYFGRFGGQSRRKKG